ncbi:MAG: NAD-glutamate dehydrogenase [Rhodoferax sp.]|nr:NAD-glutamate dehydrogenase [Rhodoferax sp.]
MTPGPIDELATYAQQHGGSRATQMAAFVAAYFEAVDPAEVVARGPATLFAIASTHWRLLEDSSAGPLPRVRVFNPTLAEDGFASDHTLLQIVQQDMPFLVDSVTMAVNGSGRTAHWIVHPLVRVTRAADGQVLSAVRADGAAPAAQDSGLTSLILVECDRIVQAEDRRALQQDIERVLGDVRAAVQDWQPMCERLRAAGAAAAARDDLPAAERSEAAAFLQWLEDGHFTFLGAQDHMLVREPDGARLQPSDGSGLGILRDRAPAAALRLQASALALIDSPDPVLVTKAMTRSTVHRSAWLDTISVKRHDAAGRVIGESRFLGLYTAAAYTASVATIPRVRQAVAQVLAQAALVPESHAAKSLQAILHSYPRDELFQVDSATLQEHAIGILRLQERQRTRVFLRRDAFGQFTSVQVFVQRDRYNTELRVRVGQELLAALGGGTIEFTPMLTDSPLARIHYVVRSTEPADALPAVDLLEARIARLARRWEDECTAEMLRAHGEGPGLALAQRYAAAFPTAYREDFAATVAAQDADILQQLTPEAPLAVQLYRPLGADAGQLRFKIFHRAKVALSDSLPVLEAMGARVLDEHPYRIGQDGGWIHDLGLQVPATVDLGTVRKRFETLFLQAWQGQVESDRMNQLVLHTGLDAGGIALLRALARYFRQLGFAFSQSYIETTLQRHPALAEDLVALFQARLDPALTGDRQAAQDAIAARIDARLADVQSLDEDRILRQYLATVRAIARTSHWRRDAAGRPRAYTSFKLRPSEVPGMPQPVPLWEIWVYAPRFEGLHLRGGKVARGGLRWSDRREDFRTEILGLVKAQQVKNTVIVPVGSKGGFVLKNPPPAAQRDALMAEGIACYRMFLGGLLDLTDNIVAGRVVPPPSVVRHDEDDPYLVVAADKGTATFSDIANAVSAEYGFWLGDAFASGGSQGYDHKKMGITARGAWESVKRHFRALGHDTQRAPFTVAGIGDMSGDVFGNGMLLSEHIRLQFAFDHRHIFIDPAPDAARALAERQRLFALPRSSWDDYDRALLSEGGGIYPRSAKAILPSPQACVALDIPHRELTPNELIQAILLAPVDLLYNGGIGTYVKASHETHAQAGDRASDAFRVDGAQLRCKVLAEGGNLGCTQNGRIEFAAKGGLIYTDAIDNSAGVDCSDHEVNIKILLGGIVEAGDLTTKQRNELLASMTDDVARLVLADNYYQTQAIDVAVHRAAYLLDGQQGLMRWLEGAGRLNRALEFLPTDAEIARRRARQGGLTAPENAVLMAYAKMSVFDELMASDLPDDPFFGRSLQAYFPPVLSSRFPAAVAAHPLRREIIATHITNTVVNRTGATFVNFLAAEAAGTAADVVRAFTLAREVFDLEALWDRIDALDGQVPAPLQLDLLGRMIAMAQRAARWMLRARTDRSDLPSLIARYQPAARMLRNQLAAWLPQATLEAAAQASSQLQQAGVDAALAQALTALDFVFPALDLTDLAQQAGTDLERTAKAYFGVDATLSLGLWRAQINRLPTDTLWQTQARGSARDDAYAIAAQITLAMLRRQEDLASWRARHARPIERLHQLLSTIGTQAPDLAPVSVALRELRHLA